MKQIWTKAEKKNISTKIGVLNVSYMSDDDILYLVVLSACPVSRCPFQQNYRNLELKILSIHRES